MTILDLFLDTYTHIINSVLPKTIGLVVYFAPIALAFVLANILWHFWIRYIQSRTIANMKFSLLELRLPKEMMKSPVAMENFLTSLHNTSDGGWSSKYWKGDLRPQYSLEIVSVEGQIKFYIRSEDRRKGGVMSALYAQFPGIEVKEVEDYTRGVVYDPSVMKVWGAEFQLSKGEDEPYPIKTYVDYGLDRDPKEEFKIDPLAPGIEFLGNVGPNQQIWIQMVIRAHKKEYRKAGHLFKKTDPWKDNIRKLLNKELQRDEKTKIAGKPNDSGFLVGPQLTSGEQEVLEALERKLTKFPFDVGIRAIYMSDKKTFDTPFGIGGMMSMFKQFSTEHMNGFSAKGWVSDITEPWHDYKSIRRNMASNGVIMAFKRRSFFFPPFKRKWNVLNAEELATIFHFPGSVVATPSLERIPSKKSEAPVNLPV